MLDNEVPLVLGVIESGLLFLVSDSKLNLCQVTKDQFQISAHIDLFDDEVKEKLGTDNLLLKPKSACYL